MTTKTRTGRYVEFFATSPRLAHAYRYAARHNNVLNRLAEMHELGQAVVGQAGLSAAVQQTLKRPGEVVVLSHADEDHFVPADEKIESLLSGAFYLLFTEPTTHPRSDRAVGATSQDSLGKSPSRGEGRRPRESERVAPARQGLLRIGRGREAWQHHRRIRRR